MAATSGLAAQTVVERSAALAALAREAEACVRCALAASRTHAVVGTGNPDAELMLVGEAPGFHEDRRAAPFVGQAGALLERLLADIGLTRSDVYLANVLKCRPPGNRDPLPEEVAACEGFLFRQVALVAPRVLVALGTVATRLLTGRPDPIGALRGQAREARIADRTVVLYPVYHPAAALYTPAMLRTLEDDVGRIPALLAARSDAVPAGGTAAAAAVIPFPARRVPLRPLPAPPGEQLGLF